MSRDKFNEFVATVESMAGQIDDVGHGVLWASGRIDDLEAERDALQERVERWIPVGERLPDFQAVLCWNKDDGFPVAEFIGVAEWPEIFYDGEYTHWMPLPLPPTKQEASRDCLPQN